MLFDFQFRDDGRRVHLTRGMPQPAAGSVRDDEWWYLSVEDAAPVRLRETEPGETRQDVWEAALHRLDESA